MKLEKLSAIAELVSSIAIVATLIYLAIQTGQNSDAIRAAARESIVATDVQLLLDRANDPGRLIAFCKAAPTPIEMSAATNDMIALIRLREHEWLQFRDGVLDEETWLSFREALAVNLSDTARREFWDGLSRTQFNRGFVAHINEYLAETPPTETENCD